MPTSSTSHLSESKYQRAYYWVINDKELEDKETSKVVDRYHGYKDYSENVDIMATSPVQSLERSWFPKIGTSTNYFEFWTDPKPFTIVSRAKTTMHFHDLLTKNMKGEVSKKHFKKLVEMISDIKQSEPKFYQYLKETDNELDVDQLICLIDFIGAEKLPKEIDFVEMLNEAKGTFADGI